MTGSDSAVSRPILVTGALGTIGRHVVVGLLERGRAVRTADVDRSALVAAFGASVEAVRFDFTDPTSWAAAFKGVEVMFLMRPPHLANIARDMVPALGAAKAAGVGHVVLLSLQGAEGNKVVPHAKIEAWLRDSGLRWTFVRPSFFMENLSGTHAGDIRDRDEIVVPAGRGATSFVAASDVADVVVAALDHPDQHVDRAWTPTGPQALTYGQVAEGLTEVLGRRITYSRPGVLRYALHARRALGMPWGMVGVTTAIYTVARVGRADGLTDDVTTVTGHAPVAFADWAAANAHVWARR